MKSISQETKERIKREIRERLSKEKEVRKIVIFGSFIDSDNPADIDVAIFQDSKESYLTLAMKYRKLTREIAKKIALDIIPIRADARQGVFLNEIESGSVEKALKAIIIEKSLSFKKTHSILELKYMLSNDGINIDLPDEECEFLDSVYLPSKYPIMSVLPEFDPDFNICKNGIEIAKQVISLVEKIVQSED
ncbi:hypothetical protein B6D60_11825 [candidate division KSB1 bacterium 4484_87]|nr:MAG: hypothetical protein B6D60_11825 [candidate division KSB1 bacterium 4484_87]